jgi:thiamine transport system permease protein
VGRPVDRDRRLSPANRLPVRFVAGAAALPVAFLLVFYAWPLLTLLAEAFELAAVADALSDDRTRQVLWFTTWQATVSTALTVAFGLVPTWAVSRFAFPGRRLLLGLLTSVFVLPTVVVGAAFVALLPASLDRSVWAIIAAHVVFNLAVVVRTVGAVWTQLPDDLDHAAATLGASRLQVFRHLTLPLLRPALAAAAAIVFLFTFTSFGVVRVLGGVRHATIEVEVWRRATQLGDIGGAAVLSIVQLVVLAIVIAWSGLIQRRAGRRFDRRRLPTRGRPTRRQAPLVAAAATATAVVVGLPLAALVERSFRRDGGYSLGAWRSLSGSQIRPGLDLGVDPLDALQRSFTTMLWATLLAVVIGGAAVVAIDALGRAGRLLDAGLMLPLGTSAVTIGFGMLITFDHDPVDWRAAWWLVPLGHALVAVPFVVRGALGVVRSIPPELRHAAATLGASPVRAWTTTTLPLLRRALANGAGLAAAISLGEFGASSFLSRSGRDTLPIAIERLLGRTGSVFQAQAFALSTILAVATIAIVLLVDVGGDDAQRG